MSEPFIGQIMQVGFNFAPRGYSTCQGQLLSIAQNTALFSLLGTVYGGNGQQTFALPNASSRVFVGVGQGGGLSPYVVGQVGGTENTTLNITNMPAHTHTAIFTPTGGGGGGAATGTLQALSGVASGSLQTQPANGLLLANAYDSDNAAAVSVYAPASAGTAVNLGGLTISGGGGGITGGTVTNSMTGNNAPFSTLQPYLAITTIIALVGVFPSRN